MIACRDDIYINFPAAYRVNQSVLVCDATTLFAFFTLQWFWLANTLKRMFQDICKQGSDAFQNAHFTFALPILQVFCSLGKKSYFHISSNDITLKLPFLMSSSPCRRISTILGDDMIYSVSSIAYFFVVSFLRYFTAFCIKLSSSAMMLNSRKSSAFNCSAVIIPSIL